MLRLLRLLRSSRSFYSTHEILYDVYDMWIGGDMWKGSMWIRQDIFALRNTAAFSAVPWRFCVTRLNFRTCVAGVLISCAGDV